ncbi:uroporphyrinogen decarboxylase [Syntrophotalea carbinolica DSM 2380]|uniref:Uroporphyrinogen decarboxylase n=1 Tax=Syntrophotalea carbinolica (strain DSM 2380 / NBRC 103641 / GraBd1) TaxID=338963 RepID=DCUP_SYNC1|nr:uroporphyrinogen decarboxylase [Syntrophotalea carbinolica]Q3A6H9.3 RecName: Full=Uroporphyrinogen decarboxylase; Short=UPD; Short=URO-D [Syntrophotalea carbinolica DSM 2380]ABA88028.4 uroporphyrinogen decarboxylase [Syntrophotalea carbinolica DSM 2380]
MMPEDYDFINACYGRPVTRTPVWLMRQAGRYLPQYRKIRERVKFLELCKTPELAAEVTLQPVDALGVDAAILFSDILIPIEAMGQNLFYRPAPVLEPPVRTAADVEALRVLQPEQDVPFVLETIRLLRRELDGRVPLIGFGGAPFTLACYMVEGAGSRHFLALKRLMYQAPETYARLMDKITDTSIVYLRAQAEAGAQALQVFDSWGGILSPADYQRYVLPYSRRLLSALGDFGIPLIHFVKGAGAMLDLVAMAGGQVVGLDWCTSLNRARDILGNGMAVQGNLDPSVLLGAQDIIEREVRRILDENAGRPGHIFNLGHGILPEVPPENAAFLVDCVHRLTQS